MGLFDFVGKEGEFGTEMDWDSIAAAVDLPELDHFYNPNGEARTVAFQKQEQPESPSGPTAPSMQQQRSTSFAPAQTNMTAASPTPPHYIAPNHLPAFDRTNHTMMRTPMKGMHEQQQLFTPPPTHSVSLSLDDIVSKGAQHPSSAAVLDATRQHAFAPAIVGRTPLTYAQMLSLGLQEQIISPRSIPFTRSTPASDQYQPLLQFHDIATARSQHQQNIFTPQSAHAARFDPASSISSPAMSWTGYSTTPTPPAGYAHQAPTVSRPEFIAEQQSVAANVHSALNLTRTPSYMSPKLQGAHPTNQPPSSDMTTDHKNLYMSRALQIQQHQMRIMQKQGLVPDHQHRPMNSGGWQQCAPQNMSMSLTQQQANAQQQFQRPQQVMTPIAQMASPHLLQPHHSNMNALVRMGMKSNGTLGQPIDLTSPTFPPPQQPFGSNHGPMFKTSQPMSRKSSSGVSRDSGICMTPPAGYHQSTSAVQHMASASTSSGYRRTGGSSLAPAPSHPVPIPPMSKKRKSHEMVKPGSTMDGTNSAPPPKRKGRPAGSKTKASPQKIVNANASTQEDFILTGLPCDVKQPLAATNETNNVNTPQFSELFELLAPVSNSTTAAQNFNMTGHTHLQSNPCAAVDQQGGAVLTEATGQGAAIELGARLFGNHRKQRTVGRPVTMTTQPCINQSRPAVHRSSNINRMATGNVPISTTALQSSAAKALEQVTGRISCKAGTSYLSSKTSPISDPVLPVSISEEGLANLLTAEIRRMDHIQNANNPPASPSPALPLVQGPATFDENAKALLEEQKEITRAYNGRFATIPDCQTPAANHFLSKVRAEWTHELGKALASKMDLPERWVEVGLAGYVPPHRR